MKKHLKEDEEHPQTFNF